MPQTLERSGVHYTNFRIEPALRPFFGGKEHWRKSLGTRDRKRAEELNARAFADFMSQCRLFLARAEALKPENLTAEDYDLLVRQYVRHLRERAEAEANTPAGRQVADTDAGDDFGETVGAAGIEGTLSTITDALEATGQPPEWLQDDIREFLEGQGIFSSGGPAHAELQKRLTWAALEALNASYRVALGRYEPLPLSEKLQPKGPALTGKTLADAFSLWRLENRPAALSIKKMRGIVGQLEARFGADRDLALWTRSDFKTWQRELEEGTGGAKPNSRATVHNKFNLLRAMFALLVKDGEDDDDSNHCLKSNPVPAVKNTDEHKGPEPYTAAELRAVFAHPIWTVGERWAVRDAGGEAQYWVPLLGLFTGARIEELCSLQVNDVRDEDGVWFLRIAASIDGKTPNAYRRVPVHRKLIELGFLDYCRSVRDSGAQWLFPALKAMSVEHGETRSHYFGRWYRQTFLPAAGVNRDRVGFHSYRNNAIQASAAAGADGDHRRALFGHSRGDTHTRSYMKSGFPLRPLDETVQLIAYPSVDFSAIRRWGA